jgi:hypothetical protein
MYIPATKKCIELNKQLKYILPQEVIDLIKTFAYKEVSIFTKHINTIAHSYISSMLQYMTNYYTGNDIIYSDGAWYKFIGKVVNDEFGTYIKPIIETQAQNCLTCGNYITNIYLFFPGKDRFQLDDASHHIFCKCKTEYINEQTRITRVLH